MNFKSKKLSELKSARKDKSPRVKDFMPFEIVRGNLKVYLARHFGFCFGVERAVEIAYRSLEEQRGKRVFLLSEMIHNPGVNADLQSHGVKFLCDTAGNELIPLSSLVPEDTVILPAFGVSLEVEARLRERGVQVELYDTTCPFVERVWKRAKQLGEKGYTIIIHGKPYHEETRATFSRASQYAPTLTVMTVDEARQLAGLIRRGASSEEFAQIFGARVSEGFDFQENLKRCGVVNQTTMLAEETSEVVELLREAVVEQSCSEDGAPLEEGRDVRDVFADTRDTLCYATSDNQRSVKELLNTNADFAVVIGGFNSSNTTHLAKLCRTAFPTYHIRGTDDLISDRAIVCRDEAGEEREVGDWMPRSPLVVALTAGASTPDMVVEQVIDRLEQLVNGA
jgi:4-hydroxy-3-methylbut-2-enyl diphosphate reductase